MPELPEVDHARALLEEHVLSKKVSRVEVIKDDTKVIQVQGGRSPKDLPRLLEGKVLKEVKRKGKYLWLNFGKSCWVLAHFGMTGSFVVRGVQAPSYKSFKVDEETWPPRFWKVVLAFSEKKKDQKDVELAFLDARRFGKFVFSESDPEKSPPISELGPDAFLEPPSVEELHEMLLKRKRAIKAVLLDQSFLSGIGNWVGDEILFHAKIHPEQPASSLTKEQVTRVHSEMGKVLSTACEVQADSSQFPSDWLFHSRWTGKKASKVNGKAIKFITVGSRTTAFVPSVQKKTPTAAKTKKRKERE